MGLNSEFERLVNNIPPRLAEVIKDFPLDENIIKKIRETGTSFPEGDIQSFLKQIVDRIAQIEQQIQNGGSDFQVREQLSTGVFPVIDNTGGRAKNSIVEQIAEAAGYEGELHQDFKQLATLPVMIVSNPMVPGNKGVVLFKPLSGVQVLDLKGIEWQAAVFRKMGFEEDSFGIAYLKKQPDSV